jgi:hypothetical protein
MVLRQTQSHSFASGEVVIGNENLQRPSWPVLGQARESPPGGAHRARPLQLPRAQSQLGQNPLAICQFGQKSDLKHSDRQRSHAHDGGGSCCQTPAARGTGGDQCVAIRLRCLCSPKLWRRPLPRQLATSCWRSRGSRTFRSPLAECGFVRATPSAWPESRSLVFRWSTWEGANSSRAPHPLLPGGKREGLMLVLGCQSLLIQRPRALAGTPHHLPALGTWRA